MIENKLESKDSFHSKIERYYLELAGDQIPFNLLSELVDIITDSEYNNYKRFWEKYPKSRKRYSQLRVEDLEHPFVRYKIIDFFKDKAHSSYETFSQILFKMNHEEFCNYEITKFNYETK